MNESGRPPERPDTSTFVALNVASARDDGRKAEQPAFLRKLRTREHSVGWATPCPDVHSSSGFSVLIRPDEKAGRYRFECIEAAPGDLCGHERDLIRLLELSDDDIRLTAGAPTAEHHSVSVEEFAAGDIEIADPLIGGTDTRLLPAASTTVYYGEGGSGKTTFTIDQAFHLAAGVDWLGFQIPVPVRVMLLENEGPIDEYRLKIRRKLASWDDPSLGGRLFIHETPWGRVDLRRDEALYGLAEQLALHESDVLIAGPVRRLGLEGGGTPAETVAYMQLLDRVRIASGRPVAIVNVHHENKGGDISGAFEAEFDTVVQVKSSGKDGTSLFFRKSRWSSKIHRARIELSWVVATEGFAVLKSDLEEPTSAVVRDAEETSALDWLTAYVTANPGVVRGKAETAYHEAHGNHGRNLARRIINSQIALAIQIAESTEIGEDRRDLLTLAAGPGETKHGVYLYPANHALSPLAATPTGETGETIATPSANGALAMSPPPIEEAAAGETPESGDTEPLREHPEPVDHDELEPTLTPDERDSLFEDRLTFVDDKPEQTHPNGHVDQDEIERLAWITTVIDEEREPAA